MANKTIANYTAASTIDAVNDLLLIQQAVGPIYKSISRNVLLGITGSPLGTSDTQSITSKTLDNTNTITLKDTLFTLQDDGDTTKQARFQLSGITTGNTRTYTMPNASVTLASLTGTETLTNKTITSPAITGGTIDNTAITVDSISGHSTSTIVTVGGVQMNNGVIGTSGAVTSTAIAASGVQPQALQTGTGTGWSWSSWTPTWSGVTVGNGTVTARYIQIGKAVFARLFFLLGTTSVVGGDTTFSLPVTATGFLTANLQPVGTTTMYDGTTTIGIGYATLGSTTTCNVRAMLASGTYVSFAVIGAAVPITWGNNSSLAVSLTYEAS